MMHGHEVAVFREFEDTADPTPFVAAPTSQPEAFQWEETNEAWEGEAAGAWYPHQATAFAAMLTAAPEARASQTSDAELDAAEETPLAEIAPVDEAELFIDEATDGIRGALDAIKTRTRIAGRIRDENKLTNLVFFDHHPERSGRPLAPDEPHYADLRWEWLAIRDTIVRPALRPARRAAARYDRDGAIAYARKFWLQPCDDQFIGLGSSSGKTFVAVDPGTRFEHDSDPAAPEHAVVPGGSPIPWTDLDDCTHFISCCIGERPGQPCGGLKITLRQLGAPPTAPYGIVRVSSMVSYLVKTGYAQVVAEKSNDDTMISQLSAGDLIAYFNIKSNIYSHMTLLLPDNKIACHTYCRSDQPECTWDNNWDLGRGNHTWTFLRIVA
jgi:hypothetical protein